MWIFTVLANNIGVERESVRLRYCPIDPTKQNICCCSTADCSLPPPLKNSHITAQLIARVPSHLTICFIVVHTSGNMWIVVYVRLWCQQVLVIGFFGFKAGWSCLYFCFICYLYIVYVCPIPQERSEKYSKHWLVCNGDLRRGCFKIIRTALYLFAHRRISCTYNN